MEKKCTQCNEVKGLDEFQKDSRKKDGKRPYCKSCNKKSCLKYSRTIEGFLSIKYSSQKRHSKIRGHVGPSYSLEEFKTWVLSQSEFQSLFNDWIASDYDKNKTPSVDRKNDYKGYSLDNIQLMTWDENRAKGHRDRVNGVNNKLSISIMQLSKLGELIKEHYSTRQASESTKAHRTDIVKCCKGKRQTAGGFKWMYKTDYKLLNK